MFEHQEDQLKYTCSKCGQTHSGFPDLAFDVPFYYQGLTDDERARARLSSDTCVIDDDYFVRGVLEIPIHGGDETFGFGVWVTLSHQNYQRYEQLYEQRDRLPEEPYFGWFSNRLPGYPDTLNLKTNVYLRPYPTRPRIELHKSDHPLALEQRGGITVKRVQEILEANEHAA
jgi:hypothetical protein